MTDSVDPDLAAAVLAEGTSHSPGSRSRRAARHVWVCLMITTSVDAARRAIPTFGDPAIHAAATELLDRLTATVESKQEALPGGPGAETAEAGQ